MGRRPREAGYEKARTLHHLAPIELWRDVGMALVGKHVRKNQSFKILAFKDQTGFAGTSQAARLIDVRINNMHSEVLTGSAVDLFPHLSIFADDFYMAGGTGLALQLGHRISVDFDLFSLVSIKRTLLNSVEQTFRGKSRQLLVSNRNELSLVLSGVKVTFLHYPFPVLLPLNETGPIPILNTKEILATKAYTIGRRGEFKDYVDLYCGLQKKQSTLAEIINLAQEKFTDAFNARLFLEQLVYLDDIEVTSMIMKSGTSPSKTELVDYFSSLIKAESV